MKNKLGRNERICQVLLDGKPHMVSEFHNKFKDTDMENIIYRISTYIYMIKKMGGNILVHRNGREVDGYQLLNPDQFDSNGRPI